MTDTFVPVISNGVTYNIDNESVTASDGVTTKYRQKTEIAGALLAQVAKVLETPPGAADYGLVVRDPATAELTDLICVNRQILATLRAINVSIGMMSSYIDPDSYMESER